jgi:hypothetical protein
MGASFGKMTNMAAEIPRTDQRRPGFFQRRHPQIHSDPFPEPIDPQFHPVVPQNHCPFVSSNSNAEFLNFPIADHPVIDLKINVIAEKIEDQWRCRVCTPIEGKMAKEIFGPYANRDQSFPLEEIIPVSSRAKHNGWVNKIFNEGFVTEFGNCHILWDSLQIRKKDPEQYVYILSPCTGSEIPVHMFLYPYQKTKSDRYEILILAKDLRPKKWVNEVIQNTLLTFHNLKNGPIAAIDLLTPVSNIMILHKIKKQNLLDALVVEDSQEKREDLRSQPHPQLKPGA